MIFIYGYTTTIRRNGTAVGYKGENQKELRKRETWILAFAPNIWNRFGEITIHAGSLIFKIEFLNHTTTHPQCGETLQAFVKNCKKAAEKTKAEVPTVDRLGLDSETQPSSEAQSINEKLIYYHDECIEKKVHLMKFAESSERQMERFSPLRHLNLQLIRAK